MIQLNNSSCTYIIHISDYSQLNAAIVACKFYLIMLHDNKAIKEKESGRFYFTVSLAHEKMLQTSDCTNKRLYSCNQPTLWKFYLTHS